MKKLENSSYHWDYLWTKKITNFYPRLPAAWYFEDFVRRRIYFKAIDRLLENISLKDKEIIELGSGTGNNSLHLAKTHGVKEVTLVDFSKKALERVKINYFPSLVNKINKDIFKISLEKKYDFAHSTGLIEHFQGKERFLVVKKHADLIRDEGLVMIWVPIFSRTFKLIGEINKILGIGEQPFTKNELRSIFQKNGLKIINEEETVFGALFGVLGKKQ